MQCMRTVVLHDDWLHSTADIPEQQARTDWVCLITSRAQMTQSVMRHVCTDLYCVTTGRGQQLSLQDD